MADVHPFCRCIQVTMALLTTEASMTRTPQIASADSPDMGTTRFEGVTWRGGERIALFVPKAARATSQFALFVSYYLRPPRSL